MHNIPEGLAVSMVLASRGVSPQKAMLWSVITSLPQVHINLKVKSLLHCEGENKMAEMGTY